MLDFAAGRRFKPHWAMTLMAFFVMTLLSCLGFWQLARAVEKEQLITRQQQSLQLAPVFWSHAPLPHLYQQLVVQGHFLSVVLLLDNQHHQHQFGYDVLSPLVLLDGSVVLVDRGFMAADGMRRTFPHVDTPEYQLTLQGYAYYPSHKSWLLGQNIEEKAHNMATIERIDASEVAQFLHKSVHPFIIRLDKQAVFGYVRDWSVVAMSPERHRGYALQWFSMALVVFILFIALNIKKKI